jgi:small-conductance mechanosensitive channel
VENQYNVGEVVKLASLSGTVENLTLRCTTLRDGDGTIYIIPNSQIATVANLSRDFSVASVSISVDASADPEKVLKILKVVAMDVRRDPKFDKVILADPEVLGVDKIAGREVNYPVNFRVRANQKDGVLRAMRQQVITAFEKEGIPLGTDPANLFVLHKNDPTAPPSQQPLVES